MEREHLRGRGRWVFGVVLTSCALAGCPPQLSPSGDAGVPCMTERECNPDGRTCGQVSRCITGFCTAMPIVRVCEEGGAPSDGARPGECLGWEDCNSANACGQVISCVNFLCDRTGPRIEIPCLVDAGSAPDR